MQPSGGNKTASSTAGQWATQVGGCRRDTQAAAWSAPGSASSAAVPFRPNPSPILHLQLWREMDAGMSGSNTERKLSHGSPRV